MSDDFNEKFREIGGLWPTRSGKGLSGKLKEPIPAGARIFVFENRDYNPAMTYPKYKIFIPTDAQQEQQKPDQPTNLTPEEKEQYPF